MLLSLLLAAAAAACPNGDAPASLGTLDHLSRGMMFAVADDGHAVLSVTDAFATPDGGPGSGSAAIALPHGLGAAITARLKYTSG